MIITPHLLHSNPAPRINPTMEYIPSLILLTKGRSIST